MATTQPGTARSREDWDAPHGTPVTPEEDWRTVLINRISWGAVLAGVALALATQLILNLLGIGIGASSLDPASSANPSAATFSIGAGIWWLLSGIISALVGGYTAGRLAGQPKESSGGWHGLTAWALATLLMFGLLTTTIGAIAGGAFWSLVNLAGGAAQAVGTTAQTAIQAAAPGIYRAADPFASVERAVRDASGGNDPAALRDAAVSAVRAAVTGDPTQAQDARQRAAQALAKAQSVPVERALAQITQYEQEYRQALNQAKQQATAAAQMATTAISRAALLGSLALLLGAIAAWFAGRKGAVNPTITTGDTMTQRQRLH